MKRTLRTLSVLPAALLLGLAVDAKGPDHELRFEITRSERLLHVYDADSLLRTEQVAVGQPGHQTPTGEWEIFQVDLNPDWQPPDSDWAAGLDYTPPGHPDNPMGRARLIFDPPFTIHGTDDLDSLGRAASHGSVRVANEVVIELARKVLKAGGAWEGEEWFDSILANPAEMHQARLEYTVPIRIRD